MLILECPPTVVAFSFPGLPGKVLLLDSRNLGIEACHLGDTAFVRARTLCQTLIGLHRVDRELDLGGIKCTAGSQGFHTWRYKHMTHPVYVHTSPLVETLEREALHGGRCEAYYVGSVASRIYHLDVKSLYPAIGTETELPAALDHVGFGRSTLSAVSRGRTKGAIVRCRIETNSPVYPVRRDGETIYPVGRYTTTLCGDEWLDALAAGRVREVYEWAVYLMQPCLREHMLAWYNIRQTADSEGDRALSAWSKAVMVCTIGKFAQHDREWERLDEAMGNAPYEEWYELGKNRQPQRYRSLDWTVSREVDVGFAADASPAITAFVCATGRNWLWRCLSRVWPDHVYYCDTDSVIVDDEGYSRLQDAGFVKPGVWGYLQIKEIANGGDFFGRKHYRLGDHTVHSGRTVDPDCAFRRVDNRTRRALSAGGSASQPKHTGMHRGFHPMVGGNTASPQGGTTGRIGPIVLGG